MKTAVQELIEIVEMDYNNGVEISMKLFHKMLTDALLKEKEQIIDAYDYAAEAFGSLIYGEQYYNEKYENNELPKTI